MNSDLDRVTGFDHFSSHFVPLLFVQSIPHIVIHHHESTGQFPEHGGAPTCSTRQSAAGRHATKWRCIFRHPPSYPERVEQSPNTNWMATNCSSTIPCYDDPADVCISTHVHCEDLMNTKIPRITQLGLLKPEYHLTRTFHIATSFERTEFEQSPDRVRHLYKSRFVS